MSWSKVCKRLRREAEKRSAVGTPVRRYGRLNNGQIGLLPDTQRGDYQAIKRSARALKESGE